jgi:hypothetical protein
MTETSIQKDEQRESANFLEGRRNRLKSPDAGRGNTRALTKNYLLNQVETVII